MKETRLFPKVLKLETFGHGPWINEPDLVVFLHAGVQCKVIRDENLGYLQCFCLIPLNHSWYKNNKTFQPEEFEAHGRIREVILDNVFSNEEKANSKLLCMYFSCCQDDDLVPANDNFEHETKTYRNVDYAVEKLKYLAEQIVEAHEPHQM